MDLRNQKVLLESDDECAVSVTNKEQIQMNQIITDKHQLFTGGRRGEKRLKWNL